LFKGEAGQIPASSACCFQLFIENSMLLKFEILDGIKLEALYSLHFITPYSLAQIAPNQPYRYSLELSAAPHSLASPLFLPLSSPYPLPLILTPYQNHPKLPYITLSKKKAVWFGQAGRQE
jgi:hypothetical protein